MILQGDCRERMAEMEENSIDAIVCDPPYELGFMGKKWDGSGIAYDQEVFVGVDAGGAKLDKLDTIKRGKERFSFDRAC